MKHAITCLLSAALLLGVLLPAKGSDEAGSAPNLAVGIAGSYGWYNAWQRRKGDAHMTNEFSPAYGGGIVFEKMFNNIVGINSGLWFNHMTMSMGMRQPMTSLNFDPMTILTTKMNVTGWSISIPLTLVTSLNASVFSFQFLAGIKYTHIVEAEMKVNNPYIIKKKIDLLPLLNQPQFGFTAGIIFKFRVAQFVDVFFGGTGTLYVTQFIKEGNDISHLFDLSTQSGIMFRTNIFPIPKEQPSR